MLFASQHFEILVVEKDCQSPHSVSKLLFNPIFTKTLLPSNLFVCLGLESLCFTLSRDQNFRGIVLELEWKKSCRDSIVNRLSNDHPVLALSSSTFSEIPEVPHFLGCLSIL